LIHRPSSPQDRDTTYLIEIKHQIQLAYVPKETIQYLDKEMYSLKICQLVIIRVDAGAEEKPSVAPVDDLVVAELDEVGLVFLVAGSDEAVDLILPKVVSY
jgi:hypothetical protein